MYTQRFKKKIWDYTSESGFKNDDNEYKEMNFASQNQSNRTSTVEEQQSVSNQRETHMKSPLYWKSAFRDSEQTMKMMING